MPPSSEPSRWGAPVPLSALFPLLLLDPVWHLRLDLRQAVAGAASNAGLDQPGRGDRDP